MRSAWVRTSRLGRTPRRGVLSLSTALALSGCATHSSGSTHEDGIARATTLVDLEQPAVLWRSLRNTVARNLVDFQHPLDDASGLKQAAKSWFTPFYAASSTESHPANPLQPTQQP